MKAPQSLAAALEQLVTAFRAHGRASQALKDGDRTVTVTLVRVKDAVAGDVGMELRAVGVHGGPVDAAWLLAAVARLGLVAEGAPAQDAAVWRVRVKQPDLEEVA